MKNRTDCPDSPAASSRITMHPFFGILALNDGWAPPIRFLLRRNRILSLLQKEQKKGKSLLEIGCGAGTLLVDLAHVGFECTGVETSSKALALASLLTRNSGKTISIFSDVQAKFTERFDYVCAFDVLEHIEDDKHAIEEWAGFLKEGGTLMLSVPAHSSRFGYGDRWAGHYRRYDRIHLEQLLTSSGFKIEHFECYGFPIANITEFLGESAYRKLIKQRDGSTCKSAASAESGIERDFYAKNFYLIKSILGTLAFKVFFLLQWLTRKTDFGSGYIVIARKP